MAQKMAYTEVRTADLNPARGDAYIPPANYQHPYTKEAGWEILAGQDITDKRYKTTRYMLVYNPTITVGNKAAILTAAGTARTRWVPYAEGKTFDMVQLFDKLDNGSLDG